MLFYRRCISNTRHTASTVNVDVCVLKRHRIKSTELVYNYNLLLKPLLMQDSRATRCSCRADRRAAVCKRPIFSSGVSLSESLEERNCRYQYRHTAPEQDPRSLRRSQKSRPSICPRLCERRALKLRRAQRLPVAKVI